MTLHSAAAPPGRDHRHRKRFATPANTRSKSRRISQLRSGPEKPGSHRLGLHAGACSPRSHLTQSCSWPLSVIITKSPTIPIHRGQAHREQEVLENTSFLQVTWLCDQVRAEFQVLMASKQARRRGGSVSSLHKREWPFWIALLVLRPHHASIHALVPHGSGTACCSRMTAGTSLVVQ